MSAGDLVVAALLLVGVTLSLLAAVGLNRFTNVYSRMHAATKPATLGVVLVAAAASTRMADPDDTVKLLVVIVLQLITAPVGAHLVGRAAYRGGTPLGPLTLDELAEAEHRRDGQAS
jgi:multicomponent Na+:H+ antiporter subunit G